MLIVNALMHSVGTLSPFISSMLAWWEGINSLHLALQWGITSGVFFFFSSSFWGMVVPLHLKIIAPKSTFLLGNANTPFLSSTMTSLLLAWTSGHAFLVGCFSGLVSRPLFSNKVDWSHVHFSVEFFFLQFCFVFTRAWHWDLPILFFSWLFMWSWKFHISLRTFWFEPPFSWLWTPESSMSASFHQCWLKSQWSNCILQCSSLFSLWIR